MLTLFVIMKGAYDRKYMQSNGETEQFRYRIAAKRERVRLGKRQEATWRNYPVG